MPLDDEESMLTDALKLRAITELTLYHLFFMDLPFNLVLPGVEVSLPASAFSCERCADIMSELEPFGTRQLHMAYTILITRRQNTTSIPGRRWFQALSRSCAYVCKLIGPTPGVSWPSVAHERGADQHSGQRPISAREKLRKRYATTTPLPHLLLPDARVKDNEAGSRATKRGKELLRSQYTIERWAFITRRTTLPVHIGTRMSKDDRCDGKLVIDHLGA